MTKGFHAKLWIINNQLARRNITLAQRIGLVEEAVAIKELKDKGKEHEKRHHLGLPLGDKPINIQAEVARRAGVSIGTVAAYDFVRTHADKKTKLVEEAEAIKDLKDKGKEQRIRKPANSVLPVTGKKLKPINTVLKNST